MGIKKLHDLLRKKCPQVYKKIHVSKFRYSPVAVDISLYMYKYKTVCGDKWMDMLIRLILILRKNDVHVFLIFDGNSPVEKEQERERRRDSRNNIRDKINKLIDEIDAYKLDGTRGAQMLHELGKLPSSNRLLMPNAPIKIDMRFLENRIEKLQNQIVSITDQDTINSIELCEILSIPNQTSLMEAETTAAFFNKNGLVDAVLSDDTDVLAYGGTTMVRSINTSTGECEMITHEDILEGLNITSEQFLDLCIMCGTDYNSNIPKIGPSKAYDLILKYGNLEEIAKVKNTDCLNYERVRELFLNNPGDTQPSTAFMETPDWDALQLFLFKIQSYIRLDKIRESFAPKVLVFSD